MKMLIKVCLFFLAVDCAIAGRPTTLGRDCNPSMILSKCGPNERCSPKTNATYHCTCQQHYTDSDGECVAITTTAAASKDQSNRQKDDTTSSGSSVAVGILVPTFLIALGGLGFCCARRYRLLPCRQNLYGNVLVTREEDDDDDPPIA